ENREPAVLLNRFEEGACFIEAFIEGGTGKSSAFWFLWHEAKEKLIKNIPIKQSVKSTMNVFIE
ncbi:MAG TPA: hypothetical protein VFQ58_11050, partial [Flavisolibacter sp.]|nr:hypothetical protein [Flavisolibacter sp.]